MNDQKKVSRREFLQRSAVGAVAASSAGLLASCLKQKNTELIPKRILGKTGLQISILSFGGGSQFLKNKDGDWEPLLERAFNAGINYYDTSQSYRWGATMSSEERYGLFFPRFRDKIVLCTKFDSRDPDEAMKMFERSLKRLKTDYVDILMIHSIEPSDDVNVIEKGVYREMLRLKDEGTARFIGFSSMDSSEKSKELIEKLDFDVALLAMNPTKYGDYAKVALPAARKKNMGVLAMKVMRDIVGKAATPAELLQYAWTQDGVASALVGHFGMSILEENIRLAKQFHTKNAIVDRHGLETRLAHLAGPHALCWARPDYCDGMMV